MPSLGLPAGRTPRLTAGLDPTLQYATKTCKLEGCEKPIPQHPGRRGGPRNYCSDMCRDDARRARDRERDRERYAAGYGRVPCASCGNPTGWPIRPTAPANPVCQPCRRLAAQRTCKYCGSDFHIKYRNAPAIFCSTACFRAWQAEHRHRTTSTERSRQRRAQLSATWDGVTDQQIYERDEWICQIPNCTQLTRIINGDAPFPAPDRPSIDHIIPVTRGGTHSSTNRRASHLLCNNVKHNFLDEEIELKPQLEPKPPKRKVTKLPWPQRLYHRPCRWCGTIVTGTKPTRSKIGEIPEFTVCATCQGDAKCSVCGNGMYITISSRPPGTRQCRTCRPHWKPREEDLWWTNVRP